MPKPKEKITVDYNLLNKQRKVLYRLIFTLRSLKKITGKLTKPTQQDIESLEGILNLLDVIRDNKPFEWGQDA